MEKIVIKIIKKVNKQDFILLNKEAGWWKKEYEKDLSFIEGMVKNAFCFVGVFHGKKMIGMGRSISDKVSDAYIQDVTVLKKYRGKGIGKKIIKTILQFLRSHKIGWVGLIAEPGSGSFYKDFGFKLMKNYKPMLLEKRI